MNCYHCKHCNYYTKKISHFKRHLKSQKHLNLIENSIDVNKPNDLNYSQYLKVMHICNDCGVYFASKQSLQSHKKIHFETQEINKIINENIKLKQDLENKDQQLKIKDKQLSKALDVAKNNSKSIETTINILKYAKLNLNKAEPLKEPNNDDILNVIKYKNPKGTETKNETYVKTAIHQFNHHIFHSFVGDMIVEYYKPKKTDKANVIATDTSRLCFIIMQKITKGKKEQKEWINDKSGKKFTEFVLNPVIDAVKQTLIEFVEFKKTKELNESNLCLMAKCIELKRDIEVNKFTNQILKYVAPHFHFDNLKLLTDIDECTEESVDDLGNNTKSVKIKTKNNK